MESVYTYLLDKGVAMKTVELFRAAGIDMGHFTMLQEHDLIALGISSGAGRQRIMALIREREEATGVVPLECADPQLLGYGTCKVHGKALGAAYCVTDSTLLCEKCMKDKKAHKGHEVMTVMSEAAQAVRGTHEEKVKALEEMRMTGERIVKACSEALYMLKENESESRESVQRTFGALREAVNAAEEKALREIEEKIGEKRGCVERDLCRAEEYVRESIRLARELREMVRQPDAVVLTCGDSDDDVMCRVEQALKEPPCMERMRKVRARVDEGIV